MTGDSVHGITMKEDSLYGVGMRLFELRGVVPSFSRTAPSDSDTTICLAAHAWDYYWDDNKQYRYIGDFIDNGNELASGSRKAGFVAVVGDKWQIGISTEDSVKEYVKAHNGSMFRQFALVSAGQICEKQFALKGKVTRCALARKSGSGGIWYVETVSKESLYDFAQALADYQATAQKHQFYLRQVLTLHDAFNGTHKLMDNGKSNYLEVLTAQETLLNAQLSQAMNMYDGAQAVIALYIALGGGAK